MSSINPQDINDFATMIWSKWAHGGAESLEAAASQIESELDGSQPDGLIEAALQQAKGDDNTEDVSDVEILNSEYDGLLFNSVQEAARCMLLDHLTVSGEHGPEYALEIAYTEGEANIMAEIQHCYSYNEAQLGAISDAWDAAVEWLTDEATKEFDTSFDAADLF